MTALTSLSVPDQLDEGKSFVVSNIRPGNHQEWDRDSAREKLPDGFSTTLQVLCSRPRVMLPCHAPLLPPPFALSRSSGLSRKDPEINEAAGRLLAERFASGSR